MSLNKPFIDHDNGPHERNNGYLFLSVSNNVHVCPKMLHIFWYIGVLMNMIVNIITNLKARSRAYCLPMRLSAKTAGKCTDTLYIQPTEISELY